MRPVPRLAGVCRRCICGIRRFAAIWTCESQPMGRGFIWAHR